MTQFYCKYTNVDRVGFSTCRARLEVLCGGPLSCACKNLVGGHQVIMIEVSDVKKIGRKGWRRDMDDVPSHMWQ